MDTLPHGACVVAIDKAPDYRASHFVLPGPRKGTCLCWPRRRSAEPVYRAHAVGRSGAPSGELGTILAAVAEAYDVTEHDLRSDRRGRTVAAARHAFFALARETTPLSYPAIGQFIGRDHTTIMHGIKRAAELMEDPDFAARYARARQLVGER